MLEYISKQLNDKESLEILSKGFSFLIVRVFGTVLSFIFTIYITKNFGESEWGLISLGLSIFSIICIFGRLGLDLNLVKFFSQDKNLTDVGVFYKSWILGFVFSSTLSLIVYFFGETLVTKIFIEPKPDLLPYLNWLLLSVPFWTTVFLSSAVLRARKKNSSFAFYTLAGRFVFILLIIMIVSHEEAIFVLKAHFIGIVCLSLMSLIHAAFILKVPSLVSKQNSLSFIKESFPMMLSSSILVLMSWMDVFVMGIFETDVEVGIYNVAVKITTLSVFSLQAINSILAPKIANTYASNEQVSFKSLIRFSTKINFFITLSIIVFILLFSNFLLGLFGEGFVSGASVLFILCLGQLINSLSGSVGIIMQMIGEQNKYQTFIMISLVINLILTFILTPLFGGVGAAIATVTSMIFWNVAGAYYLKRRKQIQTYYIPFQ